MQLSLIVLILFIKSYFAVPMNAHKIDFYEKKNQCHQVCPFGINISRPIMTIFSHLSLGHRQTE